MLVRDAMQHEVISVPARPSLADAYRTMQEHHIRPRPALRVIALNMHALAAPLRTERFNVTWPPPKPWSP